MTTVLAFVGIYLVLISTCSHGFMMNVRVDVSRLKPASGLSINPSPSGKDTAENPVPVVCTAVIDYSALNEYANAHYSSTCFGGGAIEQKIYDGRVLQSQYQDGREMLQHDGLVILPSHIQSQINWTNITEIQRYYIPELETIIHNLFPNALGHCFWNPMIRGESLSIPRPERKETPTANIAPMVHIDTDIGAFDLKDFMNIVEKNSVHDSTTHATSQSFRHVAEEVIQSNKRFIVLNFWRNIGDQPVSSAPLAILSTRYDNSTLAFPDAHPSNESKWYIFPNATRDEVIVFYQFDRNMAQISDLFHCSISAKDQIGEGRISFDIRAMIILDEYVPCELDRNRQNRTRPVLSFEESGCFCDEQAEKRRDEHGATVVVLTADHITMHELE